MHLDVARREIVILAGVRTAFGTMGGALKDLTATDLAVPTAKAALERAGVAADDVDHVIYGNVLQTANDAIYLPRHIALKAGVPQGVPALGVNRLCGSGFQAVITAAEQILTGQANVVLCGGTENMSMAPHVTYGLRDGAKFGKPPKTQDLLWECLTDTMTGLPMAITAENLADKYGLSREACDEYGLTSQQRWAAADAAGRFADELVAVELQSRKGTVSFTRDEHPRAATLEAWPSSRRCSRRTVASPPATRRASATAPPRSSSPTRSGPSARASARSPASSAGASPAATPGSWASAPSRPPAAPSSAPASASSDMALVEVNEAFAPQYLAVEKELGLDRSITNVNGGAIALGHPLGASGARITATLVHELRRRKQKYGLGSACIGGGQGIAVIVEAL
jgi:acetyl-CoA acyltransferase 2